MALTRLGLNQSVNLASNVTGTLPAANGGTGATSFAQGKVLQVVEGSFTGHTTTVASTTAVDLESASSTTWETAITPSATSNKILISASIPTNVYQSNSQNDQRANIKMDGKIGSGSYASLIPNQRYGSYDYSNGTSTSNVVSFNFLWSPSTTSECKVKFMIATTTSSCTTTVPGVSSSKPVCILQEILG